MSCPDCEKAGENGGIAYFRWGSANIGIIACDVHFREIAAILVEAQR